MIVYHITDKEYQPGQIVNINDFDGDSHYHHKLTEGWKKINEYLSANRPEGEPFRQLCLYAFEKPEYCVYFRKKDILKGLSFHLYQCEMNSTQGHPMILVHQFERLAEENWEQLRNEYWHPTKQWKLMEDLADELQILEEIPIEGAFRNRSFMIGNDDYADDVIKARCFKWF